MTSRTIPLLFVFMYGCGGPELRGATTVHAGQEPQSSNGTMLVPVKCEDATGARATTTAKLWLARTSKDRELLVVARRGYDSVMVSSPAVLPGTGSTVFQFFTKDDDGPVLLHDVRFSRGDRSHARLTVTDRFGGCSAGKVTLAEPQRPMLSCELRARRQAAAR